MENNSHRLSIENILAAPAKIDPCFLHTPQFVSDSLSEFSGVQLILKVETVNPIRCFKGRGTEVLLSNATPNTHFVCASAGNFGQAMAYSCNKKGVDLTVYASTEANPFKIARMKSLGANVVLYGSDFDAAKEEARRKAKEVGAYFIEDGLQIESLEGAATIGLELIQMNPKPQVVLIALGNGALFNGIARVFRHYAPETQLVAVQSKGAPAMVESWLSKKVVTHNHIHTIADGIGVRLPIPQALQDMEGQTDNALLVDDASMMQAMKLIHQYTGLVAEPSGVVGVAAILENRKRFEGQTVATIICGGNLTEEQTKKWLLI
ncbi:threonine ammonia-lyase [Pararhodonellum marinum]|uniref:threonine ammonia-lyase n=1 Tax=Pararhodonellum marinum TaxID=2755358 RepID=UPI00188E59E2|nr:pyridoxal-phosphate dependent enzyme [Pararhodonellum marinum]